MATDWTPSQLDAIDTRDKTLLLSAAAGSGKTSTLTERIIRSITTEDETKRADIGNMLIVTFTVAAAAELKTKIYNALTSALAEAVDSPKLYEHLTKQLIKLGSAKISTIDSFYLSAIKENFSKLGLSSAFRIADYSEVALLAKNVMTEVVDEFYDTVDDFPALCECFEKIRDKEDVMEGVLLSMYQECLYVPDGIEFVKKCADNYRSYTSTDFLRTSFGAVLANYVSLFADAYLTTYNKALSSIENQEVPMRAYYDALNHDRVFCIKVKGMLESGSCTYVDLANEFNGYKAEKFAGNVTGDNITSDSLFCKTVRDSFKKDLEKIRIAYFCYSATDMARFFDGTSKNLYIMYDALCSYRDKFFEEKQKRNIIELSDLKQYAYRLFVDQNKQPTEIAKEYASRFTDIYIDEYQDVDPVQDLIFNAIATPSNRFMVGDIKQSIYSFRGAEPSLFASYRSSFAKHGTPEAASSLYETIFMSENFRCNKSVIDFTNLVCSRLFSTCKESIGYTKEDDLVFPKTKTSKADEPKVKINIFAQASKFKATVSSKTAEADFIATEIERLRREDPSLKLSEIAILYRKNTLIPELEERLAAHGIKTTNDDSKKYFQNPDVLMMLSILNTIDNPQRDIYLTGALNSPIFGFSVEDIMLINRFGEYRDSLYDKLCVAADDNSELGERCRSFVKTLQHMRDMSASLPIDKFLKYLFDTDEFVASGLVCDKTASGKGGNLKQLYEYARTFESGSFKGLYSFIEFINSLIDSGNQISIGSKHADDDCVSLMTVHKAKGLERKVCFVYGTGAELVKDLSDLPFCFDQNVGIAMHLSDSTGFAVYESPLFNILVLNERIRQTEEEMRVLYVALTRAKERLYITAHDGKALCTTIEANAQNYAQLSEKFFIINAKSYSEWILSALYSAQSDFADISYIDATQFSVADTVTTEQETSQEDIDTDLYDTLREKFSFEYPLDKLRRVPAKLSVSRLSPTVLDQNDDAKDIVKKKKKTVIPDFFLSDISEATAAERGTATHLFLQFCDFKSLARYGAEEMLHKLDEDGFLPSNAKELVYLDEMEAMRTSDLMDKILSAKEIFTEQRFNMLIPVREITTDKELIKQAGDRTTAVQGVIDLVIVDEDGSIGLYDYKTDRIRDVKKAKEQLNDAHALQLSYYARAIEFLFGKSPDRVAVYSTQLAKLIDIDVCDLTLSGDIL
ncbi:MAG: hypothetical protein E7653_01580 [Ruminococcaceae bacterium]|nr:hypothetical protein [Oscillospiraceae bacterium]